jgi:hypothetical protein
MGKFSSQAALLGGVLSFQSWTPGSAGARGRAEPAPGKSSHSYLVQVHSDAMSQVLEAVMPMLDRLLSQKTAEVRDQKLEELVDFIAGQMVVPSRVDSKMAQRIAARHARVLNEFGFVTAEQLADANQSRAGNRNALADNWKKRRQVFAVRHRDESGRQREVFPLFQFEDHKPIKAVQAVLEAFGERKAPWKLALWFTSNNGWLPGQARPVDLLESAADAVVQAARRDAAGSAA